MVGLGCLFFVAVPVVDESLDGGVGFGLGGLELGGGGDEAVGGIVDYVLDGGFGGVAGRGDGQGARQVGGGDLEAVEDEAGAARVELVGGEAAEDFAEGGLDGGAVFGEREVEGSAGSGGGGALLRGRGLAGGVVVEAEIFFAKTGRTAAMAVGEDVTAAEMGFFGGGLGGHGSGPPSLGVAG